MGVDYSRPLHCLLHRALPASQVALAAVGCMPDCPGLFSGMMTDHLDSVGRQPPFAAMIPTTADAR
jgi:hypothetical protein